MVTTLGLSFAPQPSLPTLGLPGQALSFWPPVIHRAASGAARAGEAEELVAGPAAPHPQQDAAFPRITSQCACRTEIRSQLFPSCALIPQAIYLSLQVLNETDSRNPHGAL